MKTYTEQEQITALNKIAKLAKGKTNIKLVITMKALTHKADPSGKQYRYFKVYIDRELELEITKEIGILLNHLSITKNYGTCVKLQGCGEDKAWRLAYNAAMKASELGFPRLIDPQYHRYVTKTEINEITNNKKGNK